jgi:signal peptidase II
MRKKEEARQLKFLNNGLRWLWVSVIVLILDHVTKYLAKKYLILYTPLPILPGFNFALSFNKGAAFGFLNHESGWQVWSLGVVAVVVSLGILIWLSRLPKREHWTSIALCLIIGGALGNLWDRIIQGQVTDFIQLYISHFYWPSFNIADSAICIGAVMLFISAFCKKKASSK